MKRRTIAHPPTASQNQWLAQRKKLLAHEIGYEVCDLNITAGDDVAFTHSLNGVIGTKTDGKKIEMYWRATVCYRKIDGKWMVTHEHNSVPFDPKSGRASLELKP